MSKVKTKNNTEHLPKEQKWINPKIATLVTKDTIFNSIPWSSLNKKDFKDIYGSLSKMSLEEPTNNLLWDYIHFQNPDLFRPAALAFLESKKNLQGTRTKPKYCPHIEGTSPHKAFWKEELKRIIYGYEPLIDGEPCGLRISGEFYFYLNYAIISKIEKKEDGSTRDLSTFPDFLAMDYYYFKELEARENPVLAGVSESYKLPFAVAKSRRKGFSFKAAAGAVWVTAFPSIDKDKPKVLIASDTGYDATLCFKKCMPIIDHLSEYTPFGREQLGDVSTNGGWKHIPVSFNDDEAHFIFGYESTRTKARKGRLSEIQTVSLMKADKISGEGVQRIYFEESGKITHLKKAWTFARESLKAGSFWRGIAIIFGTGGSMAKEDGSKGSSHDFSELFLNPEVNELGTYKNIYEYNDQQKACGYFVSDMWANFGSEITIDGKQYYGLDNKGNAHFWVAELVLNYQRLDKQKHGKKEDYDLFLTQRCKTPSEAFLVVQGTVFPTADLLARKSIIEADRESYNKYRMAGELVEHGNNIVFKPDYEGKLIPIDTYVIDSLDREGCLLVYEKPMKINNVVPEDAYIISVDPIGQNTIGGKSLTSIIVYKTPKYKHNFGAEKIVATYRGRNFVNPQLYVQELLLKLSKYYNALITFENDRDGGILQYFLMKGEIKRLMGKPALTLDKFIPNSKTSLREYGHSMGSNRHKRIGEDLLLSWLLMRHPVRKIVNERTGEIEEVDGLRNLDMLEDRALIEELINYKRESGNYDVVMAMMGIVIQRNERFNEEFSHEQEQNMEDISTFWVGLYTNKYGNADEKYKFNKLMNSTR